jgi:peptidyl-prolyl cis-trans isomerase C
MAKKKESIKTKQKEMVVAKVNGVAIKAFQVEAGLQSMLEPYRDSKGKVRLNQQEQYGARDYVIDNLVKRELLFQDGKSKGIKATSKELDRIMSDALKEYSSEAHFKFVLSSQGLTLEQYREQMKHDIMVNKTAASIVQDKKKDISKAEARKYYDDHPEEMIGPEVRHILHVMIALDRYAPEAKVKEAREKLEKVAADVKIFKEIVKKGPETKDDIKGIDVGFVARGSIHPMLDSIVLRLEEGKISRVVKTDEGLHLMMVEKTLPADIPRPYKYVEADLIKKLYEQRSVAILDEYIEKLRKNADIDILDKMASNKLDQEKTL